MRPHGTLGGDYQDSGYVFAHEDGRPVRPNYASELFKKFIEDNGLPPITLHGLRHSLASLAKHVGMPEQVTMEIGGWADPQTMRKIYTHISQKDAERYKKCNE